MKLTFSQLFIALFLVVFNTTICFGQEELKTPKSNKPGYFYLISYDQNIQEAALETFLYQLDFEADLTLLDSETIVDFENGITVIVFNTLSELNAFRKLDETGKQKIYANARSLTSKELPEALATTILSFDQISLH